MHSKTNFRHYYPLTEFIGVFVTAWAIALCCGLYNGFDANILLLFLSTLGYYALDHALDIFKFRKTGLQLYLIACLLLALLAMLSFAAVLVFYGIEKTSVAFVGRFWPTLLISGGYFLVRLSRARLLLFVRPLLIAMGVGFAIVFPAQMTDCMVASVVCFCNVCAFAYMERHKDAELGNTSLFNGVFEKYSLQILLLCAAIAGVVFRLFFAVQGGVGLSVYAVSCLLILKNETKFRLNTYRWWLDALLPVAFLPFG